MRFGTKPHASGPLGCSLCPIGADSLGPDPLRHARTPVVGGTGAGAHAVVRRHAPWRRRAPPPGHLADWSQTARKHPATLRFGTKPHAPGPSACGLCPIGANPLSTPPAQARPDAQRPRNGDRSPAPSYAATHPRVTAAVPPAHPPIGHKPHSNTPKTCGLGPNRNDAAGPRPSGPAPTQAATPPPPAQRTRDEGDRLPRTGRRDRATARPRDRGVTSRPPPRAAW